HWFPFCIPTSAKQVIQPGLTIADDPKWIRKLRPLKRTRRRGRRRRVMLYQQDVSHLTWHRFFADTRCSSRRRGDMREQMANGELQRVGKIGEAAQCHVARTALDICNVCAVQFSPFCQFLLSNSQLMPTRPNDFAEPGLDIWAA